MEPIDSDLLNLATWLTDVVQEMGVLQSVKGALLKQPDVAATKLVAVLEELQKTFLSFDAEVVQFLAITLEPGLESRADRKILYSLEGGNLQAWTKASLGHCTKIQNIYKNYLDPWFQRTAGLNRGEQNSLANLFERLSSIDGLLFHLLEQASNLLSKEAQKALDLFEQGDLKEANAVIVGFRKDILPVRQALSKTVSILWTLEADFISMSDVA